MIVFLQRRPVAPAAYDILHIYFTRVRITTLFLGIHWLSLSQLHCRIMNELLTFCSKMEWEISLPTEGITKN